MALARAKKAPFQESPAPQHYYLLAVDTFGLLVLLGPAAGDHGPLLVIRQDEGQGGGGDASRVFLHRLVGLVLHNWVSKEFVIQCFGSVSVFYGLLDPDPYSEYGSGSR